MITNTIREDLHKSAFKYPHLEDFALRKTYAFTVSPQYQRPSFTECYIAHMDILQLLIPYCTFVLRPEISTKGTRLHYHGVIRFDSSTLLVAFYYHIIPKLKDQCTFTIEEVRDYQWYLYCVKSRHHMKPYLTHAKLHYKLTNNSISNIIKK